MTEEQPKKESEERSDAKRIKDHLAKGFAKLARITPMATDSSSSELITTLPPEQDARFRYPFIDFILNEIDEGIKNEAERQAFDFPIDNPETPGTVTPLKSTWDGFSLSTILELKPDNENTYYVCISNGDGGVLLSRSMLFSEIEYLMEDTDEEWSDF